MTPDRPEVRCELVYRDHPTGHITTRCVDPLDHAATDALLRRELECAIRGDGADPITSGRDYHLHVRRLDLPTDPTRIVRLPDVH